MARVTANADVVHTPDDSPVEREREDVHRRVAFAEAGERGQSFEIIYFIVQRQKNDWLSQNAQRNEIARRRASSGNVIKNIQHLTASITSTKQVSVYGIRFETLSQI